MFNNLRSRLLNPINPATTVIQGIFTVLWGLWLLGPWEVFTSADLFGSIAYLGPEWAWGLLTVLVGLTVLYGALRPFYMSLTTATGFSFLFWFFIAVGFFLGDWQNTGGLTYLFIAMHAGFVYLNVKVNHTLGHDWTQENATKGGSS